MSLQICRDCIYCKPGWFLLWRDYEFAKCHHPRIGIRSLDLVRGKNAYHYCANLRKPGHSECEGFSPKLPLLHRIIPIHHRWPGQF